MKNTYSTYGYMQLIFYKLLTIIFYPQSRLIRWPFYIRGKKYINLGKGLTTGVNCRFDAFPQKNNIVLTFGNNVQINDYVHIGAIEGVTIGNDVLIASKVFISDHNHGYYGFQNKHTHPSTKPSERELSSAKTIIEDNVWIGEFVTILQGVTVGEGSIIGANSVVTKSIPKYSIAVGSPARVIRKFDFEKNEWCSI